MQLGKYRHYKWNFYEVVWFARDSETLEELVIYKALYDSPEFGKDALRVRPRAQFENDVEVDPAKDGAGGKMVKRFTLISTNS